MKHLVLTLLFLLLLNSVLFPEQKIFIPIKLERNRTMVTVKVGHHIIPDIILDTGFAFDGLMIYNPGLSDSLHFPGAMKVKIPGAGGGEPSIALMVDSTDFYLGDVHMTNQKLLILQSDTYESFPSNGVMGYSIFGHYAVEFNYEHSSMFLHEADDMSMENEWAMIPIYFKKNKIPWIDVSVIIEDGDPVQLSTYIDFAAGENIELLEKEEMKFNLPRHLEDVYLGRGLSGDIYGRSGKISKLIIGPYELNNLEAAITPAKIRSKQPKADAIIGSGSLKKFNLIFDYANKKLYLKPNKYF